MKSLANFETFKLSKTQMNAIVGGITCYVNFGDGDIALTVHPDLSIEEAMYEAETAYGDYFRGCEK